MYAGKAILRDSAENVPFFSSLYRVTRQVVPKLFIQGLCNSHTDPESRLWEQSDVEPRTKRETLFQNATYSGSGSTTRREARDFFSTLSRARVEELYSAYKVDFDLFGYEADDFFMLPTR